MVISMNNIYNQINKYFIKKLGVSKSKEEILSEINKMIEQIGTAEEIKEDIDVAILLLKKMYNAVDKDVRFDATKKQLKVAIRIYEKITVSNSKTEQGKFRNHFIAEMCRQLLDSKNNINTEFWRNRR